MKQAANSEYKFIISLKKISGCAFLFTAITFLTACNKLIEIPQPVSTITEEKVFASDANANSAMAAIYANMNPGTDGTAFNGGTTLAGGLYTDELLGAGFDQVPFLENSLLPDNSIVKDRFWSKYYYSIYQANAIIANLVNSPSVSEAVKKQLTGEAKFVRAFGYFNLVNLFGALPLVLTPGWEGTNLFGRTNVDSVYAQVIQDLKEAQSALPPDYSISNGEKIRPDKWAATALLARVYLYKKDWANAAAQATAVINSGNYQLQTDLDGVFLKNSDESIFQLETWDNASANYSVWEAFQLLPVDETFLPPYYMTDTLLHSFETGDLRKDHWVASTQIDNTTYYYPYKYKVRVGEAGNILEYYTVLRFAEQYLVRAEALAQLGMDLTAAITDLNTIRLRAGLAEYAGPVDASSVLNAIYHERQIEFFAEWGHRFFDLKRTGLIDTVLGGEKTGWTSKAAIWPIPISEIALDPNLTQNPGY